MAKYMLTMFLLSSVMAISIMSITILGAFVQVKDNPKLANKVVESAISPFTFLTLVQILPGFLACCLLIWIKKSADVVNDVIENDKRRKTDMTKIKPRFYFFRILLLLTLFANMSLSAIILFRTIETKYGQQQLLTGDEQNVSLKIPDNVTVEFSDAELNQKVISVKNLTTEFIRVHSKAHLAASVSGMKKTMSDHIKTESIQFRHNSCAGLSTFGESLYKRHVIFFMIVLAFMGLPCIFSWFIGKLLLEVERIVVVEKMFNRDDNDESSDESAYYIVISVEELMDGSFKCSPAEIEIEHETDEKICIEIDA